MRRGGKGDERDAAEAIGAFPAAGVESDMVTFAAVCSVCAATKSVVPLRPVVGPIVGAIVGLIVVPVVGGVRAGRICVPTTVDVGPVALLTATQLKMPQVNSEPWN